MKPKSLLEKIEEATRRPVSYEGLSSLDHVDKYSSREGATRTAPGGDDLVRTGRGQIAGATARKKPPTNPK